MERELERMAYNGEPIPAGCGWMETAEYIVARYLYAANKIGAVDKEEAGREKRAVAAMLRQAEEARAFERKCWENSSRRTLAAERSMTAYRKNRSLEAADELVSRLDWLHDECARSVLMAPDGAACPSCGRRFDQEQKKRRPTYCEDCGCRLLWEADHG